MERVKDSNLEIHDKVDQGSPEWHSLRRGIVTASVVGRLVGAESPDASTVECPVCGVVTGPCLSIARRKETPLKTVHQMRATAASELPTTYGVADNDTSRGLIATLVAERIAGFTEDTPMTSDMWRGVDSEPIARDLYSKRYAPATEVGFMRREQDWGVLGYSPDGLVGKDGLIEIKAPRAKTHVLTILADAVPDHYMGQLQAGLLVSGRKWIDFVSYCGGLPLWVKRVHPDQRWFDAITAAVTNFETKAVEMVAAYNKATTGLALTERVIELEMSL